MSEWARSRSANELPARTLVDAVVSACESALAGDSLPYGCFVSPGGVASA